MKSENLYLQEADMRLRLFTIRLNWSQHGFGTFFEFQETMNFLLRRYGLKQATIREVLDKVGAELGA